MHTYYIDKHGGTHYHESMECPMIAGNTQYRYEPITRTQKPKLDREYVLSRIMESGKYYYPCPACMFEHRRTNDK